MLLSTAAPAARYVLLRGVDERGFRFYTNYKSAKAAEIAANPAVALTFGWLPLHRSVRITGRAERLADAESDAYFASRPRGSRLGAWASEQSRVVEGREVLQGRIRGLEAEYEGREVPRPPSWGGYRLVPEVVEFWQGRENRLHDRIVYRWGGAGWEIGRLQP